MMVMLFPEGLRKALTLSYDDGVEQDETLIRILDEKGLRATFNLNSGLFAPEGTVWPEGQVHRRMTRSQVLETYDTSRHEVAVHCLTHASLTELPPARVSWEVLQDRANLERDFGGIIRGMAYPFGTVNDTVTQALRDCGVAYSRTVRSTHRFDVPNDWLRLDPTCHHDDPELFPLLERFLTEPNPFGAWLFYLWGHAYEFEANDNWHVIREFAGRAGGHPDVWYCTNIEVCDYVNAFRRLLFSADGGRVHNPTDKTLWFELDGAVHKVRGGETIDL